jgi:hypothetical protein
MNSNLAKVGKPTRWPPGKSGNPAGKPPGTRTAFSQGFIRDFALVWAEEGLEAVRKVAKKSPEATVPRIFKKRTVLYAPAKFVNDLKDRFYNCVAKSLANPILHSASGDGHRFRHGEGYIPFLNVNHPENSQYEKLRGL